MSSKFANDVEVELDDLKRMIFEHPIPNDTLFSIKGLIDRKISESPESSSGIFSRYLRARSYEEGVFGGVNYDAAVTDYLFIMDHGEEFQSESMVGYARLLFGKNDKKSILKAIDLCSKAINFDSNVRAMMFMGFIYEHKMHDFDMAKKWYLCAFKNKLIWGLRFYASLQFKRKKFFISVMSHIAATIISPFMVIRYGKRNPFTL